MSFRIRSLARTRAQIRPTRARSAGGTGAEHRIRRRRRRSLPEPLAAALRSARLDAGLTQVALAARVGLSESTVRRLEHGRRSPSRLTVNRLTDALGLPDEVRDALLEHVQNGRRRLLERVLAAPGRALQMAELRRLAKLYRLQGLRRREGGKPGREERRGRTASMRRWERQWR